ncbi:N-acetyl-gamma-glutamyl-phosphate reductase [Microaceticoccus formicicus]|uniref:N-acetyl-gamma-glutamyl-phosphate reductase n=1 Tax=Microaceticoccus formicicus TaxID=3118105 RepID=UPI003CD03369|nr:N-acetyl-gamma-glutamyl-phosphate reductase [Peptoniphilaceae bacterium AMB_02]
MIKVGILGSSGYAGAELVRLLIQHEDVEIVFVDSKDSEDVLFTDLYPNLYKHIDKKFTSLDISDNPYFDEIDLLFCALPHGLTQKAVSAAFKRGLRIIDLSADFRLSDPAVYEKWYDTAHIAKDELKEAVYGLPEIHRSDIPGTNLIANPGCYPTSIILGLYPLFKAGLAPKAPIISDSKSGVSGAGRGLRDGNLYCQATENISPYSVGTHRHIPEIEEQLTKISDNPAKILFTPHLVPMQRGILSTIYLNNEFSISEEDLLKLYGETYKYEAFIRILPPGSTPKTKAVAGSNYCDIAIKVDEVTGYIVIMSAIDNLIKGASGQALQNMNLMFGLDESKGLEQLPLWP